jgi:hypothetical protein
VPYNEVLSAEFGGLGLHSCGKIMHNIDNVASTRGIIAFNTHDPLAAVTPIVQNRAVVISGGVAAVIAPNHPGTERPLLGSAEALENYWWEDFEKLPRLAGQRVLYQCHALLTKRTGQEAYDRMVAFSTALAQAGSLRSPGGLQH